MSDMQVQVNVDQSAGEPVSGEVAQFTMMLHPEVAKQYFQVGVRAKLHPVLLPAASSKRRKRIKDAQQLDADSSKKYASGTITRVGDFSNGGWYELRMDDDPTHIVYQRKSALMPEILTEELQKSLIPVSKRTKTKKVQKSKKKSVHSTHSSDSNEAWTQLHEATNWQRRQDTINGNDAITNDSDLDLPIRHDESIEQQTTKQLTSRKPRAPSRSLQPSDGDAMMWTDALDDVSCQSLNAIRKRSRFENENAVSNPRHNRLNDLARLVA